MNAFQKLVRRTRFHGTRLLQSSKPLDPSRTRGPIVVAALGGSGTRAIVELLVESGVYMGRFLDRDTHDSLYIRRFLNAHFDALVGDPEHPDPAIVRAFHRLIRAHRSGIPHEGDEWGWKNPRSMWLLPFFAQRHPGLRFVHLLRDGRDMALSQNHFLLEDHGRTILGDRMTGNAVDDQLELWARGNVRALEASERFLGSRALRIRYEDLCADPTTELDRLLDFLKRPLSRATVARIAGTVRPSPGLGRGRLDRSETLLAASARHAEALHRFGYATDVATSSAAPT
ncbi:MAG: sulfotransferase [Deltaproteobacteria bacterium]|nr:sulfotransferase [Deltaproteobacteria bacterium]